MARTIPTTIAALLLGTAFGAPSLAVTLFGGAEHSESLPSGNDGLRVLVRRQNDPLRAQAPQVASVQREPTELSGNVQTAAPTLERPALYWMMIPKWMAGKWHKRGDLTVGISDLSSNYSQQTNTWTDDEMTVTWGQQIDRAGNVWNAIFVPNERDGHSDGELVRFVLVSAQVESLSPEQFVTRTHFVGTEAYGNGNATSEKFQEESLNDYVPVSATEFDNKSSTRMFRMNGRPYRAGFLLTKWMRVKPFVSIPMDHGIDMRKSLAEYLHAQQRDDLIPSSQN